MTLNGFPTINKATLSLLVDLMRSDMQTSAASTISSPDATSSSSSSSFASFLTALLSTATTTAPAVDPTSIASAGSTTGQQIAATALSLASTLGGVNNRSFDTTRVSPTVQQVWNDPAWGNGNVQCVAFVAGVYQQAGKPLPIKGDAATFWPSYANQPGWKEISNGSGLPQPGDIIVMGGGPQGYGHVAIVTSVTPPSGTQPGAITVAQSNAPSSTQQIAMDGTGLVASSPGMPVLGFIRASSALN